MKRIWSKYRLVLLYGTINSKKWIELLEISFGSIKGRLLVININNLIRYDSDDNPIIKKKEIEPLPPIDHAKMDYDDFEKNFYDESEEIENMTEDDVSKYRNTMAIKVHGVDTIRPIKTFAHFGFDDALMKKIKEAVSGLLFWLLN